MQHDNLKRNFEELDPYNTNFVLREEFEETLKDLCPELNNQEMDFICTKYAKNNDGRFEKTKIFFNLLPLIKCLFVFFHIFNL